jgi:2-phosphoglycolate phosphatase
MPGAILFDFDGTLADTASDLGGALNAMRIARGLAAVPIEDVRAYASSGARGMLQVGFGMTPQHPDYQAMRADFLERYERDICVHTKLFDGIPEVIAELASRGVAWGIVTNKSTRLTTLVVEALAPSPAPACVVSGDTTPHMKPHPAPLLRAAEIIGLPPADCWYLGDDLRDIQAAQAAGMTPVAVEYGYCGTGGPPRSWNATHVISRPQDLIPLL